MACAWWSPCSTCWPACAACCARQAPTPRRPTTRAARRRRCARALSRCGAGWQRGAWRTSKWTPLWASAAGQGAGRPMRAPCPTLQSGPLADTPPTPALALLLLLCRLCAHHAWWAAQPRTRRRAAGLPGGCHGGLGGGAHRFEGRQKLPLKEQGMSGPLEGATGGPQMPTIASCPFDRGTPAKAACSAGAVMPLPQAAPLRVPALARPRRATTALMLRRCPRLWPTCLSSTSAWWTWWPTG